MKNLLEHLQGEGAKSTLLIVDQSVAGESEYEYYVKRVLDKLRAAGINVTIVFTAYPFSEPDKDRRLNKQFTSLHVPDTLSDEERERLKTLLKRKARKTQDEIQKLIDLAGGNRFMVFLYITFLMLRIPLREGLLEQFERTIGDKLHSDELQDDVKSLLILIAMCSQFNLGIPSNLAYRMVNTLNLDNIRAIAKLPFFRYEPTEDGDYRFKMRTRIEAEILLQSCRVDVERRVEHIEKMLSVLRADREEIAIMINILRLIGPNAPYSYKLNARFFRDYDERLIAAMEQFRKEHENDPDVSGLVLQEVTYRRERANRLHSGSLMSDEEYARELETAITIGEKAINPVRSNLYFGENLSRNPTVASLLVDVANGRISLYEYNGDNAHLEQARLNLNRVLSRNPDGTVAGYAYVGLLKSIRAELETINANQPLKKLDLLVAGYDFINRVKNEHDEIYYSDYFQPIAIDIVSQFDNQELSDDMFEDAIRNKKSIGIYVRACKQLKSADIYPYSRQKNELTDAQISVCRQVCEELLENETYAACTDLNTNVECQRLLLHVKWLQHDRYPIFCEAKHCTGIADDGWEELRAICERYRAMNYGGFESNTNYAVHHDFLYVLALCYAQLSLPDKCQEVMRIIREATDDWYFNEKRIITRHMICNVDRVPKNNFKGKFLSFSEADKNGYVKIKGWSGTGGRAGIYFHVSNIRDINIVKNDFHADFQLGLGYMGLAVFHGFGRDNVK